MRMRFWERLSCTPAGLLAGLLLFAAGSPPFLYAWLSTPPGLVYTGLMYDVPDHAQYWSWVTASRQGLLIANTMTPEPNPAIFLNPMMWALAQLQRATGLSFAGLFQAWRLLACLVLGVAIVMSFRAFVPDRTRRAAAYAIAVAGSGFGWLLIAAKYGWRLDDVPFPLDLYTVEPNTFFASFAYPYLALAQGLLLFTMLGAWRVHRAGHWQGYVLAVGGATALALTHAYDLVTVYAVLATFWLFEFVRTRQFPARLTAVGIAIGAASGPIAIYYRHLTATDPLWQALLSQYANAGVWTPQHLHLIVLMGLPLILAALWIRRALRSDGPDGFAAVWSIVGLGLIYLPVVYQIKLLTAWQFPLAILATHGWHAVVLPWLSARRRETRQPRRARARLAPRQGFAFALLLAAILPTNLYLYAWRFTELRRHDRPYYLRQDEVSALNWLATHAGPDDVVMAPLELGQFVPNYGASRAFLAHWAMTNHFFQRRDEVDRFFSAAATDDFRQRTLDRDGVTLVLHDRDTAFAPRDSTLFESVFTTPHAVIYRYRPAGSPPRMEARVPR